MVAGAPRPPARAAGDDVSPLVDALTALYAYVYARRRRQSAAPPSSARWRWTSPTTGSPRAAIRDSPLIAQERAALVRSYAALLSAVHRA